MGACRFKRITLIITIVLTAYRPETACAQVMYAHHLDVGQADCTLLEFPCGAVLIDAGADSGEEAALVARLEEFFATRPDLNRTLDAVFITHAHIDHTRALREIAEEFTIRNYIDNGRRDNRNGQVAGLDACATGIRLCHGPALSRAMLRASRAERDQQYVYDGLDRLTEAKRGAWNGTSFTLGSDSEKWTLDMLGAWDFLDTDFNGDGTYSSATERDDRTHNFANELTERILKGQCSDGGAIAGLQRIPKLVRPEARRVYGGEMGLNCPRFSTSACQERKENPPF